MEQSPVSAALAPAFGCPLDWRKGHGVEQHAGTGLGLLRVLHFVITQMDMPCMFSLLTRTSAS